MGCYSSLSSLTKLIVILFRHNYWYNCSDTKRIVNITPIYMDEEHESLLLRSWRYRLATGHDKEEFQGHSWPYQRVNPGRTDGSLLVTLGCSKQRVTLGLPVAGSDMWRSVTRLVNHQKMMTRIPRPVNSKYIGLRENISLCSTRVSLCT